MFLATWESSELDETREALYVDDVKLEEFENHLNSFYSQCQNMPDFGVQIESLTNLNGSFRPADWGPPPKRSKT